jgi:hypothetical protein
MKKRYQLLCPLFSCFFFQYTILPRASVEAAVGCQVGEKDDEVVGRGIIKYSNKLICFLRLI